MATIQNAVATLLTTLIIASSLALTIGVSQEIQDEDSEVKIYYDRTQPAYFLYPYSLRILVVEAPEGVDSCWSKLPNGTIIQVCKPLNDILVRVWYLELKELREARTDKDGVAVLDFRLFTLDKASFKIEVYSERGTKEAIVTVYPKPWIMIALISFAGLISSLILTVRRGFW